MQAKPLSMSHTESPGNFFQVLDYWGYLTVFEYYVHCGVDKARSMDLVSALPPSPAPPAELTGLLPTSPLAGVTIQLPASSLIIRLEYQVQTRISDDLKQLVPIAGQRRRIVRVHLSPIMPLFLFAHRRAEYFVHCAGDGYYGAQR